MIFNSLAFVAFFAGVCGIQYLPISWRMAKLLLVLASYAFYAAWYPITIGLLWLSTVFDWQIAHRIERASSRGHKRTLMLLSVALNLSVLSLFKYADFAVTNLNALLHLLGSATQLSPPSLPLPVGISFYTFMSLAFVIDVYRGVQRAGSSFLDFALFLTFYPHLVAGPIVRAQDFLPQCETRRRASMQDFCWGLALLVLGLFEKVVLADAWFGPIADRVFAAGTAGLSSKDAWLGLLSFSCQIFCDFAGYSTCAIGAAACIGFRLPQNFRAPYAALGFSDFWRRWHISLSSWLRDYLYVSLGGNRHGLARTMLSLMLTMLIGGLWHGPSWTFVIWGGLHGTFLIGERGVKALLLSLGIPSGRALRGLGYVVTLGLVCWAWVFFRAPSVHVALSMTKALLGAASSESMLVLRTEMGLVLAAGAALFAAHFCTRNTTLEELAERTPAWVLAGCLGIMIVAIVTMSGQDRAFIYFQF
jgi:alginate O-acetyltransferase complex protein AlgI